MLTVFVFLVTAVGCGEDETSEDEPAPVDGMQLVTASVAGGTHLFTSSEGEDDYGSDDEFPEDEQLPGLGDDEMCAPSTGLQVYPEQEFDTEFESQKGGNWIVQLDADDESFELAMEGTASSPWNPVNTAWAGHETGEDAVYILEIENGTEEPLAVEGFWQFDGQVEEPLANAGASVHAEASTRIFEGHGEDCHEVTDEHEGIDFELATTDEGEVEEASDTSLEIDAQRVVLVLELDVEVSASSQEAIDNTGEEEQPDEGDANTASLDGVLGVEIDTPE